MGLCLEGRPAFPKGDVSYVEALESTARSGAHCFRSRRPRSLLTVPTIVGLGLTIAKNELERSRGARETVI
jgi:hypothetical protein